MKRIIALTMFSVFIMTSCSNKKNDLQKINDLKKVLTDKSGTTFNVEKAKELVDLYVKFAENYPKDTNSVSFLFNAANLSINIKPKQAVELFDKIMKDYPDDKRVADCMFYKAFVYDEKLKDIKNAREGYEAYMKKYPNGAWSKDIPGLLKMLGKTAEQIGAELEAKQKEDSLASKK